VRPEIVQPAQSQTAGKLRFLFFLFVVFVFSGCWPTSSQPTHHFDERSALEGASTYLPTAGTTTVSLASSQVEICQLNDDGRGCLPQLRRSGRLTSAPRPVVPLHVHQYHCVLWSAPSRCCFSLSSLIARPPSSVRYQARACPRAISASLVTHPYCCSPVILQRVPRARPESRALEAPRLMAQVGS
jgi:hypothetical protein